MRSLFSTSLALLALVCSGSVAAAAGPAEEFVQGTKILGLQVGGGEQNNVEGHRTISHVSFFNVTPRLSVLPLDPIGPGVLRGSLETGLEPWFQYYVKPGGESAEGLKVSLRYHFLKGSPIFPYVEVLGGMGGTSLKVMEIKSAFTLVLEAGGGLGYFVADGVAVTAGYRFQHISNGKVERPNRGFNSDTGVVGVSFFFH